MALAIFGAFRMRGPEYGVLFSNLQPDEANAVVQKLDAAKIPHRLAAGGATILIPQENLYEERIALAGDGTVKGGGQGWELFDKTDFGMTDSREKIDKIRATQGELQRTIGGLTPVLSARVHIASPQASLYSETQLPTTTSVVVQTKPGMQLSSDEVRGITQLVSGAVEGLKPENVTVLDQNGTVLRPAPLAGVSGSDAGDALKLTQDQLIAKERYENDLQQSLQGLLDTTIGAHRSAVRIATEMNFDANSTETKSYAPQGTIRSQQTERESYTGTGGPRPAAGVPGTTTNVVPTYQGVQQQTGNSRYTKSKTTTNYEITEQNAKHVDAPGKVTRLSVAVLVNVPTASGNSGATNGQTQYTLAAADVQKIKNAITAAAGIDPARGDQISVEALPFAPQSASLVAYPGAGATVLGLPAGPLIAVLVILGLAGAGIGFAAFRKRNFKPTTQLPTFDSTLAEELPTFEEHPMLDGTPAIAAPIRSSADLSREQMVEYVTTVAQENPDAIAKLIKLWLAE